MMTNYNNNRDGRNNHSTYCITIVINENDIKFSGN